MVIGALAMADVKFSVWNAWTWWQVVKIFLGKTDGQTMVSLSSCLAICLSGQMITANYRKICMLRIWIHNEKEKTITKKSFLLITDVIIQSHVPIITYINYLLTVNFDIIKLRIINKKKKTITVPLISVRMNNNINKSIIPMWNN